MGKVLYREKQQRGRFRRTTRRSRSLRLVQTSAENGQKVDRRIASRARRNGLNRSVCAMVNGALSGINWLLAVRQVSSGLPLWRLKIKEGWIEPRDRKET
jgi:hypothetical protein